MKKHQALACGDSVDKLILLEEKICKDSHGRFRKYWNCQCECGNTIRKREDGLFRGKHHSCGCDTAILQGTNAKRLKWKGVGDLSKTMFTECRRNAKTRGIKFNITIENAWKQFEKQKGICAISGVPIQLSIGNLRSDRHGRTASLDRIDSNQGYTTDNIQWVHKTVNLMKNITNQSDFIEWCRKITNHNSTT